jgi:nitric oxide reductase NorD protein
MAEPEELLIEGARRATVVARELWRRARPPEARREVSLIDVRRRLELVVAAIYGDVAPIVPADPAPAPTWLARLFGAADDRPGGVARASTDGASIWLPRVLPVDDDDGTERTAATYRLLAMEQAARVVRGTPTRVPRDRLEQDLYSLAEAVAVDRALAHELGGVGIEVRAARAAALRARPSLERLSPIERGVEQLVRDVLGADPATPSVTVPLYERPDESACWAREIAARLRREKTGRYRGTTVVALWGQVTPSSPPQGDRRSALASEAPMASSARSATLRHRPCVREAAEDEDDEGQGTWMIRADEPMESAEDPMGLQRPADRDDDADAADLADSLSELPEARVVRTPGSPREVLESDAPAASFASRAADGTLTEAGIVYPEWDYRLGGYRERGAVVRSGTAPRGPAAWVDDVMARQAPLIRRVRRRFEGLRPRRTRVGRQPDGPDVDLAAYVSAFADWRSKRPGDDRFYAAIRPARRDLAIALLADVSASTDGWISGALRIIDVEKESLVVLLEALDALGDRHAAFAFSGEGPGHVRVLTIKDFRERAGVDVRRRVAALEPDRYTRTGAAIRHASARLADQPAHHRLLLILSDGKPNDVDRYDGRYGIEDTRQAVAEARLQGIVPFCLTVDREAPRYMPSIFGRGYAVLRRQDVLPGVLVEVVRRLLAA